MKKIKKILSPSNCKPVRINTRWLSLFTSKPGVIIIIKNGKPCYIEKYEDIKALLTNMFMLQEHPVIKRLIIEHEYLGCQKSSTKLKNLLEKEYQVSTFHCSLLEADSIVSQIIELYKPQYNQPSEFVSIPEHLRVRRRAFKRAYEPWSRDEDQELIRLIKDRKTKTQIASALRRSDGAIWHRMVRLGINPKLIK